MLFEWPILITGFSAGVLGSVHCVGMCGPLVASMPFMTLKGHRLMSSLLLYHLGRILMYAIVGIIAGLFGRTFSLFGLQQVLSIASGALILILFFSPTIIPNSLRNRFNFNKPYLWFSTIINHTHGYFSIFALGLLNGLLPCGLVYIAVGTAVATGSLSQGAFVMILFGIGTIPLLTIALIIGKLITLPVRDKFRKLMPYLVVVIATLLIVRGLGLDIPYISPSLEENGVAVSCHDE